MLSVALATLRSVSKQPLKLPEKMKLTKTQSQLLADFYEDWFSYKSDEIITFAVKHDIPVAGLFDDIMENAEQAGLKYGTLKFWESCESQLDTLSDCAPYDYQITDKKILKDLEKLQNSDPKVRNHLNLTEMVGQIHKFN